MGKNSKQNIKKALDEVFKISNKKGNGILRYTAEINEKGELGRYSLVYINPNICNVDNGRVLGYDNDHGYHHRHYMGKIEHVNFKSFNAIKIRFESEWRELHDRYQKGKEK
jgi:hypothetical protein